MDMTPNFIQCREFDQTERKFEIFLSKDFSSLKKITQVYCFVVNVDKTKIMLCHHKRAGWLLPGGTTEEGESVDDTLRRELIEEGNVEIYIDKKVPFYFQRAFVKDKTGKWIFKGNQIRYVGLLKEDNIFVKDPDGGIIAVDWFNIGELEKHLQWGKTGDMIEEHLLEYIEML
ncbi:TPA: hypothetical protein DEP90_02300 [Patescibacteria group bacterium]|nr:hypothetical protein [Patescibacteria group bacterium]